MTLRASHVTAYRRLTALYPRSFREEYRADLVALFTDQLHDGPAAGVWIRTIGDLVVTVPSQHLEVQMKRSPGGFLTAAAIVVAQVSAVTAAVFGFSPMAIPLAVVAVLATAVAVLSWRANHLGRGTAAVAGRNWWKFLLAGIAAFATLALGTWLADDTALPWVLLATIYLAGWILSITGAVLGTGHLIQRLRARHANAPAQ
jgi:hypothetical protein